MTDDSLEIVELSIGDILAGMQYYSLAYRQCTLGAFVLMGYGTDDIVRAGSIGLSDGRPVCTCIKLPEGRVQLSDLGCSTSSVWEILRLVGRKRLEDLPLFLAEAGHGLLQEPQGWWALRRAVQTRLELGS
jgi:hypothetical protein